MNAYIECEIRDKDGKLISTHRQRSKSFVANMLRILRRLFITAGITATLGSYYIAASGTEPVDTTGTARGVIVGMSPSSGGVIDRYVMKMDAGAGDVTHGIRVGSGTTPATPTDYNLATPIAHGTGSGQLDHGAVTVEAITIPAPITRMRIIRTFTNSSGASITVNEIAMIAYCHYTLAAVASQMVARDVLTTPQSIPNGQTLTVRYILETTT